MIILIDQDGPLADFEGGFLRAWQKKHPNEFHIPLEKRRTHKMHAEYPVDLKEKIREIYHSPGFILNLEPISGAIEAIQEMLATGYDIRICTSPLSNYENCIIEKYKWVEKHLGREFTEKIILTKDKTLINGDYFIDDNPKIEGVAKPEWEHIIFDEPYNQDAQGKRLMNWGEWEKLLI